MQLISNNLSSTTTITAIVDRWQSFLKEHSWQHLMQDAKPQQTPNGIIYELPNYLHHSTESFALCDMRALPISEPHYHPAPCIEIYFILQGSASIYIDDTKEKVSKNDVIVIEPNKIHFTLPDNECVMAIVNSPAFSPEGYIPLK